MEKLFYNSNNQSDIILDEEILNEFIIYNSEIDKIFSNYFKSTPSSKYELLLYCQNNNIPNYKNYINLSFEDIYIKQLYILIKIENKTPFLNHIYFIIYKDKDKFIKEEDYKNIILAIYYTKKFI